MTKLKAGVAWVLSALLSVSFIMAGWPKLDPGETMIRRFENWGYSPQFAVLIGVLELLSGLLVLVPRTALFGGTLIVVLMVGAVYTHLSTGIGSPLFAFIFIGAALMVAFLRFGVALGVRRTRKADQ
ncbi:MAG: DoxX family protein [Pseudomonadota bacterium]